MKRNGKVLSLIIAFAMITAMFVIPVSATTLSPTESGYVAPENTNLFELWGYNWNYDTTDAGLKGLYGYLTNVGVELDVKANEDVTLENTNSGRSGNGKLVKGSNSTTNFQKVNFIPVEENAVYRLTVDVKLADTTTSDTMVWNPEINGNSLTKPELIAQSVSVTNTDWTTISYIYRGVATNASTVNRMCFNMRLYATTASSYYIDNWTLTKVADMQATVYKAPTGVNLFDEWCFNGDYDKTTNSIKGLYGTNLSLEMAANGSTMTTAAGKSGNGSSITGASSTAYPRINFIPVEAGVKYRMTVDVKLNSAASDTMTWKLEPAKMTSSRILRTENLAVNNTGWTTVACEFLGDGTPDTNTNRRDVHLGIYPTNGSDFTVDNWTLTKVTDFRATDYTAPTGVNLFDEWYFNWNYDTTTTTVAKLYGSDLTPTMSNTGNPTVTTVNGRSGNGSSITGASSTAYPNIIFIPVEAGVTYKMTADIKLSNATSDKMDWIVNPVRMTSTVTISETNLDVTNADWTTAECVFKADGTPDETYNRRDISVGIYPTGNNDFIVDNWTLTKLPAPSVTSAEANSGKAVFTFNNDVVVDENNFTVSPATATVNVTGSGSEYTVELSDYVHSTEYTITTNNIEDIYGQALTSNASVKIVTPADSNATILNTEELTAGHKLSGSRGTFADGTYTRDENDTTGSDSDRRVHAEFIHVVPGIYVVTAKVKQNAADTVDQAAAWIVGSVASTSNNCIALEQLGNQTTINKDGYTEISGIIRISEGSTWNDGNGDLRDDDSAAQAVHAGIASSAHIFDIQDLQVRRPASLNLDNAYAAVVKEDGENANLYIAGPASTVYFAATTYTSGTVTDVQFKKLTLTVNNLSVEKLTKGDSYKFFIWDSNFKPLNSTFTSTDF